MSKSVKKSGASIRPTRSPVVAIRLPRPTYEAITKAAKKSGKTLSEFVADLIGQGQEWQEIRGTLKATEKPDEMQAKVKLEIADEIRRAVQAELDKRGV